MTTKTAIRDLLNQRFEARRSLLDGIVTAAPTINGRSTGLITATVAGQAGVPIIAPLDTQPPLAPGDTILVQQFGSPAAAYYGVLQRAGGPRPDAGMWQFSQSEIIGGTTYLPGDILLGSTLDGWSNWWYQFVNGRWVIRSGITMHGVIGNANGLYGYGVPTHGVIFGPDAEGQSWLGMDEYNGLRVMHYRTRAMQIDTSGTITVGYAGLGEVEIGADGGLRLKYGGVTQVAIDGQGHTLYGVTTIGRPLGPALELGEVKDLAVPADEALWRYGMWLRDKAGERFFAVLSGTEAHPETAMWRVGRDSDDHFLQMRDTKLSWAGENTSLTEDGVFTAHEIRIAGQVVGPLDAQAFLAVTRIDLPAGCYLTTQGNDLVYFNGSDLKKVTIEAL